MLLILHIIAMKFKISQIFPLLIVSVFTTSQIMAQNRLITLEKNSNVLAKDLVHTLNKTKDSLLLRSNQKIHYIYSINSNNKKEIDQFIDRHEVMIPLDKLSSGKHVVAVSLLQRKILFVIRVHDPQDSYIARKRRPTQVASRYN